MSLRSAFQAKMIETIGGPLMAALCAGANDASAAPEAIAASMASLLNRSVQFGIGLANTMDLKAGGEREDAVRLALTGLAGGLVADLYRQTGAVPTEAAMRKLMPAIEAVLIFADNFSASEEAVERMGRVDAAGAVSDEYQATMQYIHAFAPVITEVSAFSFGRPDRKMMQEVADRIVARADDMTQNLFPGSGAAQNLRPGIVQALARIYAACHRAEQTRLQGMDDAGREALGAEVPLDTLWRTFEERAAMLEMLSAGMTGAAVQVGQSGERQPAARRAPAAAPPSGSPSTPAQTTTAMPSAAPAAPLSATPSERPANPMGFFKPGAKKPPPVTDGAGDTGDIQA